MALSMEVEIVTLTEIFTTETASVAISHMYVMIKTTLDCYLAQHAPFGALLWQLMPLDKTEEKFEASGVFLFETTTVHIVAHC